MNYFQILSFSLGAVIILTRFLIEFFPKRWKEFELNSAYTEEKPKWIWYVAIFGLIIIAFTWYMHFTTDVPYSIVITLFVSLTVLKTSQVLFNYENFRSLVVRLFNEERKTLTKLNVVILILGIAVFSLGLFLY